MAVRSVNVRRLAAIDMYGTSGTTRRRRLILAEFLAGFAGMLGFSAVVFVRSSNLVGQALGLWLVGAGLNYLPLAVYAIMLSGPGVLDAELAGVDLRRALRRYGVLQLWILVPLSLVVFTAARAFSHRTDQERARR